MTCNKAVRLVEKLADGEATASERAQAEAHIESCEDCREHYQFVRALETASEKIDLPEPPEAYWQHFPSKVMARLDKESEARRGFWATWLTPSVLRFGAVAATVTVVIAVGLAVWRDDPEMLEPVPGMASLPSPPSDLGAGKRSDEQPAELAEPEPVADAAPALEEPVAEARLSRRTPASPAEPAPLERDDVSVPESRDELAGWQASTIAGVEEEVSAPPPAAPRAQRALAEAPGEEGRPAETETLQFAAEATLASDAAAQKESPARARANATDDNRCTLWRRYLEQRGDEGEESLEARYRVALCSIEEHEAAPSEETLSRVHDDIDAFLALDEQSDRAEELRTRQRKLRR